MLRAFLLVGIGGFAGSISRYGVSLLVNKYVSRPFPLATFIINLAGCFLIGLLFGLSQKYQATTNTGWWLAAATGFCGGFTTFSAFALENNNLLQQQQTFTSLAYILLSAILGIFLCRLGVALIK